MSNEPKRFSQYLIEYDEYCDQQIADGLEPMPFALWLPKQLEKNLAE